MRRSFRPVMRPKPRRPMTETEMAVVRHLYLHVVLPPDGPDSSVKGFVRGMHDEAAKAFPAVTDAQGRWIDKLRVRYRSELPPELRIPHAPGLGGARKYGGYRG